MQHMLNKTDPYTFRTAKRKTRPCTWHRWFTGEAVTYGRCLPVLLLMVPKACASAWAEALAYVDDVLFPGRGAIDHNLPAPQEYA